MAATGPIEQCDAALRIAATRWRAAVDDENRRLEFAVMAELDQLLERRWQARAARSASEVASLAGRR
jgi:hypothetical protein